MLMTYVYSCIVPKDFILVILSHENQVYTKKVGIRGMVMDPWCLLKALTP